MFFYIVEIRELEILFFKFYYSVGFEFNINEFYVIVGDLEGVSEIEVIFLLFLLFLLVSIVIEVFDFLL